MISKKRIFEIIEKSKPNDFGSTLFDWFIIILIITNVLAVILESYQSIADRYSSELFMFETVSVILFTVEIIFRLLTSDLKYPDKQKLIALIKYLFSFMFLIDFFAVIPFYLPFIFTVDLRFLRILRLTRILRVLKIQRYNNSFELIGQVFKRKKYDLLVTIFVTFLLLLLASSMMYYLETDTQPELFPNIIASFWWGIATLTTVGYGDVYPVTILGKILSGIIALLGVGIVALPTGIISSGFVEVIELSKKDEEEGKNKNYCPNCGEKLD